MAKKQSKRKSIPRKKPQEKKSELNNPHDALFKYSFGIKSVIIGYMTEVFPKEYGEKLDLDTLERDNNTYISGNLKETMSDVVWRCRLKTGRMVMLSFLFEHKSYKPKRPHLQLGAYQFSAYLSQELANPDIPLVQVIPIMVFHGLETWEFVEPFETYFDEIDPEFMRFMPSFDFILDNIQNYSDEVIQAFNVRFLEKTFLSFKHFRDKDFLKRHFVELLYSGYSDEENDIILGFIKALDIYLSTQTGGGIPKAEYDRQYYFLKSLNPEKMSTTEWFFEKYKKEGRQEGRQEEREHTILNFYRIKGWSVEQIADAMLLSNEYVQSVIDKFEKNGTQKSQN
jgi:predicted transposase/invertase (TIGR01784 family)